MSELDDQDREYERLLLRSAALDVPDPAARERTLEAGLRELDSRAPLRRRRRAAVLSAVLALLGGAVLSVHFARMRATPAVFSAERPAAPHAPPVAAPSMQVPPERKSCPEVVVARGDALLIDDFEANDSRLLQRDGRTGTWATYDDGTASQKVPSGSQLFPTPIPGRRGESKRALYASGEKFRDWGVAISADLADSACYDVSNYGGLRFWAKGKGLMHVGLQMIDVQALKFGGFCAENCYNVHRKPIELERGWRRYEVRWEELRQLWPANRIDFDPRRVRMVEFVFFPENTPFEVWVDDLEFSPR